MSHLPIIALTMLAFAANSILCRLALAEGLIDPASFTILRLWSGAITLALIMAWKNHWRLDCHTVSLRFTLYAGLSLFTYAALFSFAYLELTAGSGALLLFGAVQLSLLLLHWCQGQRFNRFEILGMTISLVGFVCLMLPSASQPDLLSALLMVGAGIAWAMFTALGKQAQNATIGTTWGFIAAALISLLLLPMTQIASANFTGITLAILSGTVTSALGYLLWYHVMSKISLLQAAVSQLSVPAIALVLGALLLDEPLTLRDSLISSVILGGIALVFWTKNKSKIA
ncbi:DMT family transporter [Vibrio ponticus]|uniref:DMT family transporter n=1 Tax=Vibrio ponticus TaxID=265668 RepID=A0A3N3E7C9_9VIBR|nr:DMT family transporter [Vibrio ponticus]ROV62473.1 DMT family transporter [Vibrio ponticus]ROV62594.1 DMT family transporter [Vibrio ponticus]